MVGSSHVASSDSLTFFVLSHNCHLCPVVARAPPLQHRTAASLVNNRSFSTACRPCDSMDSAKSTLHSVELATRYIRNAIARYSSTTGLREVRQHSLVQIDSGFQTIIEASCAIIKVLDDPLLRRHYTRDDKKLVNWLSGPEPEICLGTLRGMERLLNIDHEVQEFSGYAPAGSRYQEDNIHKAVVHFDTHKTDFDFLLTTSIW